MGQGFLHQPPVLEYKYLSCVPGVNGKIHPEGIVQHSAALLHGAREVDAEILVPYARKCHLTPPCKTSRLQ